MTTNDEGARGFAVILHELEDGDLHKELSAQLQQVCASLATHAEAYGKASGSISLTLKLSTERGGAVQVDADIMAKTPKVGRGRSIMWLSKGHNLVARNPKQQRLPIREVEAPVDNEATPPARDVATAKKPTRTL